MRAFSKLKSMVGHKPTADKDSSAGDKADRMTLHLDSLLDAPAKLSPILSSSLPEAQEEDALLAALDAEAGTSLLDLTQAIFDDSAKADSAAAVLNKVAAKTLSPPKNDAAAKNSVFVLKTDIPAGDIKMPAPGPSRAESAAHITAKPKAKPDMSPPTSVNAPSVTAAARRSVAAKPASRPAPPALRASKSRATTPVLAPNPSPETLPANIKETEKPMSKTSTLTAKPAKPSDKLSADLAQLDEIMSASKQGQPTRELGPRRKTASLTHMRNDLAQLNKDMSSGEQFYAQSLRRINDLIEYAYETETTLSALEKLEPENAKLRADLDQAKKNLTDQVVRAESAKSKADAYEGRYLETRQALEKAQLSLTQMEALRESLARELETKDNDLAVLMNKAREIKNAHSLDAKALDNYKAKASELANELSVVMSARLEVETRLHDLGARFEGLKGERDTIERMVKQTRNAQRATEEHNLALKTQLETVLSDVKIFKQQFDAASQNKEAEIGLLRGKLSDMKSELAVKAGVVTRAHGEMADMREKFETAHRGRRKLLEHIEGQKAETDHLKVELDRTRTEHRQLTTDFVTAQNDIESLRRINEAQSDKLKRYMALNRKPVVNPAAFEIKENLFATNAAPQAATVADRSQADIDAGRTAPAREEPPVFATSDTPPPLPAALTAGLAAQSVTRPIEPPVFEPLSGAIEPDEATIENITPVTYPDINFDFQPETDRRAPDSPMRNSDSASDSLLTDDFNSEFEKLSAMAPIQTARDTPSDASEDLKSEAQKIEEALLEFHDLDLLAESAG